MTSTTQTEQSENDNKAKTVQIKKSDLREAYEFNMQPAEYKNRRTAVLRVWEDKEEADLQHHEEGNFYPKGTDPMMTISPRQIVEQSAGAPYPELYETKDLVAAEFPDLERGSEEFRQKVSEWHQEAEDVAWNSCNFKEEIETERKYQPNLKVEIVEEIE